MDELYWYEQDLERDYIARERGYEDWDDMQQSLYEDAVNRRIDMIRGK